MTSSPSTPTGSEIAVVGMAGRFPGAANVDAFWRNLVSGVESVRWFSHDELMHAGEQPSLVADPDYVRARPWLEGIDLFDAEFFGLSPQDAAITDPQHRIFLEVGWAALEQAGYDPARVPGQVGVFATCGMNSYMMRHLLPNERIMRTVGEWLVRHTGNDMSFLATSLSYHLDLKGPSINVQCACSSALVAVHMAAQSLLSGECDMALAGGSVVVLPQDRGYLYQTGEILARDGHCRPFDARATGTLFGSGAGVVVLRRLSDAQADGDQILAVLKGSAFNNDGASKVGFLAPSVEGQSRVVTEALAISGVDASTITYVEAHGTGTIVGDPIEVTALTDAFRRHTDRTGYCRIGSVKSNVGHLGEAAGAAAFIKTVLSLQHRQLPPTLNFDTPNPQIDFAAGPFVVNDTLREWTSPESPRRAGITALGAGGTNCHVILEEAPRSSETEPARPEQLLLLSAKSASALETMRTNLALALEQEPALNLADVAHTLQAGRATFAHRWSGVANSTHEALTLLRNGGHTAHVSTRSGPAPVAFLFPGGGAQYPNMGRGLYEKEPVFRQDVDRCLAVLKRVHGIDLRPMLFPAPAGAADAARQLARSTNSILSIFIVEYALARLWMSWGIEPAAMSGHSLGEYTAACLAGVFSIEDAIRIVKARGDVFEQLPPGAMVSVLLPEADIARRLTGRLALAAVNAPTSCVVSGPVDEVDRLEAALTAENIETQRLHIDVAAHSPMLDPFLEGFRREVSSVTLSAPTRRFISNRTGRWISDTEATNADYWVRHLRETVRFHDGLGTLLANPDHILLEVGPGRALTSIARLQKSTPLGSVTSLRHPSESVDDVVTMLTAAGRLWSLGAAPDWTALNNGRQGRRVSLPTYPFERKSHWIPEGVVGASAATSPGPSARHDTQKQKDVADWFVTPEWTSTPAPERLPESAIGHVLVFADEAGVARQVASRLRGDAPNRTFVVERGSSFSASGTGSFCVRATDPDGHAALLRAIGSDLGGISHVVYGWTLPDASGGRAGLDDDLDRAFFGPLAFAQALGRQELDRMLSVTFLTAGAVRIAGENVRPIAATTFGPSRVLPRESGQVSTRIIDLPLTGHAPQRSLVDAVAADIQSSATESVVAYRGGTRWVESFSQRRLTLRPQGRVRDRGVYIITGGLGALGLELANHLSLTCRARLVLIGRTPLPPRPEWQAWLAAHDASNQTSRRLSAILACEANGAEVLVATADIADTDALRQVRASAIDRFGAIHGIFHTAGTLDDGLISLKDKLAAEAVLRPKVHGTLALDAVFGRDDLDLVVLFSSISSVLGLQGQVDYTAANAFLDAFAMNAADRWPVVSVNWGPWRDVGLAVAAAATRAVRGGQTSSYPWFEGRHADGDKTTFALALNRDRQWVVGEHVVRGGDAVLPGTGYVELARAAMADLGVSSPFEIAELVFQAPVIVPERGVASLDLVLQPKGLSWSASWQHGDDTFATATVARLPDDSAGALDLAAIRSRCLSHHDEPRGFLKQPFMDFGKRWANVARVDYGSGEALVELVLPAEFESDLATFGLHPALLDMATGGAQALIPGFDQTSHFYVPFSYGRIRVLGHLPGKVFSHVRVAPGTGHDLAVFDVTIVTSSGQIVVDISNFCMTRVSVGNALAASSTSRAAQPHTAAHLAESLLAEGMTTAEGLRALDQILQSPLPPRVMVVTGHFAAWQDRIAHWQASLRRNTEVSTVADSDFAFSGDVEREIGTMWVDLLGLTTVNLQDNFFDVGGHSLLAVRLLNRIERAFGVRLPVAELFAAPSLASLATAVRAKRDALGPEAPDEQERPDPPVAVTATAREGFRRSLADVLRDADDEDA